MENKEIIKLESGETTLGEFFTWVREKLVRSANKQWVIELPAGAGNAVVRDSKTKVTIDLSRSNFAILPPYPESGTYTLQLADGVLSWEAVSDACP